MFQRTGRILWMAGLLASGACMADSLKEIEFTSEPPVNGKQIFTVRMRPAVNQTYEAIVFDCSLSQEFMLDTPDRGRIRKVSEPAVFTYRRKDIKLTEDLDAYVSFRVPVGLDRLRDIYGVNAFTTNSPVFVSRMKISAIANGATAWSLDSEAAGLHAFTNAETAAKSPPAKKE